MGLRHLGRSHILVYPIVAHIVLAGRIIALALGGAQDLKKERLQPETWPAWETMTSYWPFAAVAAGRAKLGGFRPHTLGGGLLMWLGATWLHMPIAGWRAGIWRWIP